MEKINFVFQMHFVFLFPKEQNSSTRKTNSSALKYQTKHILVNHSLRVRISRKNRITCLTSVIMDCNGFNCCIKTRRTQHAGCKNKRCTSNYWPDFVWLIVAKHVRTSLSTTREETLFELYVVHPSYQITVRFVDYMSIATVSMHQQNGRHEYHYETYPKSSYSMTKNKQKNIYCVTAGTYE